MEEHRLRVFENRVTWCCRCLQGSKPGSTQWARTSGLVEMITVKCVFEVVSLFFIHKNKFVFFFSRICLMFPTPSEN